MILTGLFVLGLIAGYLVGWYVAKNDTRLAMVDAADRYGVSMKDLVLTTRRMVEIAEATIREKGTDIIYYPLDQKK
jgi:hypothetical protein